MKPLLRRPFAGWPSWRLARQRLTHSLKLRLVLVFLVLAACMALVFLGAAQKAFALGWREAARPLLMDYVNRLADDVSSGDGSPPSVERARAIVGRLPLTIDIAGPEVNWRSHPGRSLAGGHQNVFGSSNQTGSVPDHWGDDRQWQALVSRTTPDGHTLVFGINDDAFERRPRLIGYALGALLILTLLAWLYVRRLLRPLDAIGEGARRFGAGDFSQPIALRSQPVTDELGNLAATINTMGSDIHQMLDAKRALLLAISHELRSPLTRARLNTELLPDTGDVVAQRDALLRDLKEMGALISDLLESERLSLRHAVLQREPVAVDVLLHEVLAELVPRHPLAQQVCLDAVAPLPEVSLDRARIRLLLRNLLDNALRHSGSAPQPPRVTVRLSTEGLSITVRDHGPGVPEADVPRLAEPFFRPDAARTRAQGGVGLGLHLCKLVAQAHGGTFAVNLARPGLAVAVVLPCGL